MTIKRKTTATTTTTTTEEYGGYTSDLPDLPDLPDLSDENSSEMSSAREKETGSDLTPHSIKSNDQTKTNDKASIGHTYADILFQFKNPEGILIVLIYLASFVIAPRNYGIKNYLYLSLIIGTCIVVIFYVFRVCKFFIDWFKREETNN